MVELYGLGEAMVELYADQSLGQASTLQKSYGGDVLNALVMAQRLGASTGFCSRIGNDPFATGLLAFCQSEGVDTSQAKLVEGENGVYFISLQADGEREFTYRRAGSAASGYCPEDIEGNPFAGAKMLLLSGITQAISQSCQAATLKAARAAKAAGIQVAFDPNYRPKLWAGRGGMAAAQAAYQELQHDLDILLPSFPSDLPVLGLERSNTPEMAVQKLSEHLLALKCGEAGVWLGGATSIKHIAADPAIVRDTTGAGDAWNGAFLFYLLGDHAPAVAAANANRIAAKKLESRGAIPERMLFLSAIGQHSVSKT